MGGSASVGSGERVRWTGPVTLRGRYDGVVRVFNGYGYQLRHDMTLLNCRHVSFSAPYMLTRLLDEIDPGELIEIQYTGKTILSRSGRRVKEFIVNRLQPPRTPADKIARATAAVKAKEDEEIDLLLTPEEPGRP